MNPEDFYQQIYSIVDCPSEERYDGSCRLHAEALRTYTQRVQKIDDDRAAQHCSDGRTFAELVGHIAAWDRYTILAAGEMMAGVQWPAIMRMTGYKEPDGSERSFESVNDFNAYQVKAQAGSPWNTIQTEALRSAAALYALFSDRRLLSPARLDATALHFWHLPDRTRLALPAGWFLWMVTLEHIAVEHAEDLALAAGEAQNF